jgi:hypothetical protein
MIEKQIKLPKYCVLKTVKTMDSVASAVMFIVICFHLTGYSVNVSGFSDTAFLMTLGKFIGG